MTVAELIEKLKRLPQELQDAEVITTTCGDGGEYAEPAVDVVAEIRLGSHVWQVRLIS